MVKLCTAHGMKDQRKKKNTHVHKKIKGFDAMLNCIELRKINCDPFEQLSIDHSYIFIVLFSLSLPLPASLARPEFNVLYCFALCIAEKSYWHSYAGRCFTNSIPSVHNLRLNHFCQCEKYQFYVKRLYFLNSILEQQNENASHFHNSCGVCLLAKIHTETE